MDEDSRSVCQEQFLTETGTKFRISDLLLRFDGVLINRTDWISQIQSKSNGSGFRYEHHYLRITQTIMGPIIRCYIKRRDLGSLLFNNMSFHKQSWKYIQISKIL